MSDTADLARQLGEALGAGYVVERALGEGGFAGVFLVRDLALKRQLAVKVLSPDMIASHSVLERFRREAETVAQLSHPNIVPLHFIGERDGLLYLAMACVDGGSLADRLKRDGRIPVDDAARIMGEVASALAHAHKRGVIHRDIKPANVLIDAESGRCLVTDFGIARTAEASTLTATGMMLGTPAYLAPEQVTGEGLDHRVDIFALGVMAYEMLAGRVPFEGPTPTSAMMKRLAGPPEPITRLRPDVPPALAGAIAGCLAIDPADRFQSAADVVRALGGATPRSGATRRDLATVPPTRRRSLAAVGVAAALLVATGGWLAARRLTSTSAEPSVRQAGAPLLPPDMVAIAGAEYVIGTDSGPALARPRHMERVAPFAIGRTEVTVGAYARYAAASGAPTPWGNARPDTLLPVTRVTWGDAANYCASVYRGGRLPTETEWEAAARGHTGRAYAYGDRAEAAAANTASAERRALAPVGSFRRDTTPEGVADLIGNAWEWTSTRLAAYPGGAALPSSLSARAYRVIRGGAFDTADSLATGWMRGYLEETTRPADLPNTGFRCAVSLPASTPAR